MENRGEASCWEEEALKGKEFLGNVILKEGAPKARHFVKGDSRGCSGKGGLRAEWRKIRGKRKSGLGL